MCNIFLDSSTQGNLQQAPPQTSHILYRLIHLSKSRRRESSDMRSMTCVILLKYSQRTYCSAKKRCIESHFIALPGNVPSHLLSCHFLQFTFHQGLTLHMDNIYLDLFTDNHIGTINFQFGAFPGLQKLLKMINCS